MAESEKQPETIEENAPSPNPNADAPKKNAVAETISFKSRL